MSSNNSKERNPALCIRCTSEWRRWVRLRSRQLGINESSLIEMACAWLARQANYPALSPPIWYPGTATRNIDDSYPERYKDTSLYLNVTPDWKTWVGDLAHANYMSMSCMIEHAIAEHAKAQSLRLPPPRTRHHTHAIR